MLNYPAIYFLIAVGAGFLAFTSNATGDVNTVKALGVIFLAGSVWSLVVRRPAKRELPGPSNPPSAAEPPEANREYETEYFPSRESPTGPPQGYRRQTGAEKPARTIAAHSHREP